MHYFFNLAIMNSGAKRGSRKDCRWAASFWSYDVVKFTSRILLPSAIVAGCHSLVRLQTARYCLPDESQTVYFHAAGHLPGPSHVKSSYRNGLLRLAGRSLNPNMFGLSHKAEALEKP